MELPETDITLKNLQQHIRIKDHKPGMEYGYFLKLIEEIGELAEAIRKGNKLGEGDDIKGTINEELYDVLYYIYALANLYDVDLGKSCLLKEKMNADREDH